jgi:ABC-type amino acid transport substrate-binding protein
VNKVIVAICFVLSSCFCFSQHADTLCVNYYIGSPFSFAENGEVKGIEIEIIKEYSSWLKDKKNINLPLKFSGFSSFELFFSTTKKGNKNTIGLGSVTINQERLKEIDFTAAFLKNVAFCITNGNAPDVKIKSRDEIIKIFGNMTALTIPNTSLSKYVEEIKKTYVQDLKINPFTDEVKILDEISKNILYFGYVDAVGFWFYLKSNPSKFLKMQKILNQSKEELGFVLPKGSQHKVLFNEFFAGPSGFKTTRRYREILEKYLGSYMTQNLAVN